MKKVISGCIIIALAGCASNNRPPTQIGGNTYYAAKTNSAGAFGDVSAVLGEVLAESYQFCETQNKEFELVTQILTPPRIGAGRGSASITFKCVNKSTDRVMRPDRGVITIN